jgi:hypothetical protein
MDAHAMETIPLVESLLPLNKKASIISACSFFFYILAKMNEYGNRVPFKHLKQKQ